MSATTYANAEERSIFQTSADAMSDAALDARESAKVAAQNVKDGVGRGAYKAAFGLSFGVVFTGVFLTELLPARSAVRRGLEDGAGAALDRIEARKLAAPIEEPIHPEPEVHVAPPAPPSAPVRPSPASRAPRKRTRAAAE